MYWAAGFFDRSLTPCRIRLLEDTETRKLAQSRSPFGFAPASPTVDQAQKDFLDFSDFSRHHLPAARKYIYDCRMRRTCPFERRHRMHSVRSVLRAIRPGANRAVHRAQRPTGEAGDLPGVDLLPACGSFRVEARSDD